MRPASQSFDERRIAKTRVRDEGLQALVRVGVRRARDPVQLPVQRVLPVGAVAGDLHAQRRSRVVSGINPTRRAEGSGREPSQGQQDEREGKAEAPETEAEGREAEGREAEAEGRKQGRRRHVDVGHSATTAASATATATTAASADTATHAAARTRCVRGLHC